jgi:hypothetical protein
MEGQPCGICAVGIVTQRAETPQRRLGGALRAIEPDRPRASRGRDRPKSHLRTGCSKSVRQVPVVSLILVASSPNVYLARPLIRSPGAASMHRLASPNEETAAYKVLRPERAKVPAVEAFWIGREYKGFVDLKHSATAPDGHWPSALVGNSCAPCQSTADENACANATDVFTRHRRDRL